jgi:hypothetical protein
MSDDNQPKDAAETLEQFRVHLAHMIQNYRCLAEKASPYDRYGDEECAQAIAFLRQFEAATLAERRDG